MSYYDDELTDRAVECYFRRLRREGALAIDQPNRHMCKRGRKYVTIANGYRVLAQFQIVPTRSGIRLRWVELDDAAARRAFSRL